MAYLHGIDNVSAINNLLDGKKIGLITNPSGLDSKMNPTVNILNEKYNLTMLYAPEHGIRGDMQAGLDVSDCVDPRTGIPVRSLFGSGASFSSENTDIILYDIQDIGLRFYTYIYAMADGMIGAAKAGIPFVVLDRMNPLGLDTFEGTVLDEKFASLCGRYAIPSRYGLTAGELAKYLNEEYSIGCELYVVPCSGLTRKDDMLSLKLPFVLPSPNIPSFNSIVCYVGTVLFEGTNVSEGRGTTRPFETFGAPWLDSEKLLEFINSRGFEGALFRETFFRPTFSKYSGQLCGGIDIMLTDYKKFDAFRYALTVISYIRKNYKEFGFIESGGRKYIDLLLGTDEVRKEDFDVDSFISREKVKVEAFRKKAEKYFIY